MFCVNCGRDIPDHVKVCPHCGNIQPEGLKKKTFLGFDVPTMDIAGFRKRATNLMRTVQGDAPEDISIAVRMRRMASSFQKIKAMPGYYCTGCGEYIDRNKAYLNNAVTCSNCGCQIIAPDRINQTIRAFNQSGISGIIGGGMGDTSQEQIAKYYASSYYHFTRSPMEDVVQDPNQIGEYLVSTQIDDALRSFRNLHYHIYYNLTIPEVDGRLTEIDALIICGNAVIILNTTGHNNGFLANRLDDEYWIRQSGGKAEPVQNPLLKNLYTIAALKYIVKDLPVNYEHMYSIVVLKDLNERTKRPSNILELKLGNYIICKTSVLASHISDILQQELRGRVDDVFTTEKYMSPLIHELDVRSKLNEEQKIRLEIQKNNPRRLPINRYFYTQDTRDSQNPVSYLLRSNGKYIESYQSTGKWINVNALFTAENNAISWKDTEAPFLPLENDMHRLAAALCILNDSPFADYQDLLDGNNHVSEEGFSSQDAAADTSDAAEEQAAPGEDASFTEESAPKEIDAVYFKGCRNVRELSLRYKALAKIYHPDSEGGDVESFKLLQQEFEKLKEVLAEEE